MPSAKRPEPELWARLKPLAREKRTEPTEAEDRLWQALRRRGAGSKFRRQHTIDRFIVDLYCAGARLVVEVDGPIHEFTPADDAIRQEHLKSLGLRVLRFKNDDVLMRLEEVLKSLDEALATSPPAPLPPLHNVERGTEEER